MFYVKILMFGILLFDFPVDGTLASGKGEPNSEILQTDPQSCGLVSTNSRYLDTGRGINVGHWTYLLMNIYAQLPKFVPHCTSLKLHLADDTRSQYFLKRLLPKVFDHDYVKETIKIFTNVTGGISLTGGNVADHVKRFFLADSGSPEKDVWKHLNHTNLNDIARDVLNCSKGADTADILIYNRARTRRILNVKQIAEYFESQSYRVKVLYPNELKPSEQICALSQKWKAIISPHGAQEASLVYKNDKTLFFEVTPSMYYEGNRCFARPGGGWFKTYGKHVWECKGKCSDEPLAKIYAQPCSKICLRIARDANIQISRDVLQNIASRI